MTACLPMGSIDPPVFAVFAVWAGVLLLLLWVRAQRFFFGKGYFLLTFVAMLVWLGAAGLELWATEFRCKLFFAYLAWPGITLLPTAWVLFLADYAFARTRVPGAATRALLILAPLAVAAAAFTNPWHGLFYGPETRMVTLDGRASVVFDHGPLFFVAASYLYVILAAAVAICSAGAFLAYRAYRSFFLFMLFITLVPLAGNVGYVAFGFTLMGFDPTPFLFSFVLFVFTGLIFTNRVFDIGTIAKDMLFYETRNPILVIDAGGTVAAANPAALEAFGATAAAVGGRLASWPVVGFAGPMLAARAADRRATPIGAGGRRFEMLVLPISGPLDRRGAVLGWVIHAFDVTERAGLEAVLAADRDYLATLMDTSISGIIAIDAAGVMVFANAEACRILGRPQADIEGRRFDDPAWGVAGIDGKPFDSGHLPFAQVRALRSAVRDVRFSILWPDGTRRAIAVNAAPTDPGRGPARVVCAIADITERLASEEALRQAAERAEAASRTKSRFVANMSHEIRTPLNGVLGMAEVLERSVTDPEQARMVATIRDSGALLLNVLNDILDMSKIEADRLDLERIPFRPAEIAGRVSGLHVLRAGEKGLDFRIAATGDADRPRLGDPLRVTQILHNLVSNAVKFTETGAVGITIAAAPGGPVVLTVEDSGIGMTEAQCARIFDDFEQADSSVTRRFGGTGLGMSIVRRLVGMMGGTIAVASRPGQGTRVTVTLPLPEAAEAPPAAPAETALVDLAGLRILAADDSATNRTVLRAMLRTFGVEAVIVEDGRAAVEAWAPGRFDIVLLDISMPVLDGLGALAAIRAQAAEAGEPPPHAVAITANAMADQVAQFLAAGFAGHVPKPFQRAELAAALAAALPARPVPAA